ncbi:type 1 glutamine amidotransferase domain-containing protein [Litoribrevibacter albus]|uniref:Thiamine biosynthesis protein ThiJ n=1 Tax=Litoribrevibacter albus TaxID=1473156 RepID=A0AA37SCM6_9GAMM|nr:type 1 glutamine amidotransferase domain-containing protein [Litoribrevibacter albus]GLQ33585.1 hypothetical protein GCM10007876_40650 [Litoribrevibacter albus]
MILILLPDSDYDPTESAVPWQALINAGFEVCFATPSGKVAYADKRLTELGFGVLSTFFMTRKRDIDSYQKMALSESFNRPLKLSDLTLDGHLNVEGILVPGGHAQGMKTLLESAHAQTLITDAFKKDIPVAAVCHGVLLLARSIDPETGKSVLFNRKTTALPKWMELFAWYATKPKLGDYYRTYPVSVEDEVKASLQHTRNYRLGPILPFRDKPGGGGPVCIVRDGNYLSARWPGDCHTLARDFVALLKEQI